MVGSGQLVVGACTPGLSHGAMNTISAHGTAEQQHVYLTKLVSGEWTGTMCLTEPHCGTDLGHRCVPRPNRRPMAATRSAVPRSSSPRVSTTWPTTSSISFWPVCPMHRLGTKGISLFIVPKFLPNSEGAA
jgi:alkylation response protein AidB-like acyl-CoA dehydrogenase